MCGFTVPYILLYFCYVFSLTNQSHHCTAESRFVSFSKYHRIGSSNEDPHGLVYAYTAGMLHVNKLEIEEK